MVPVEPGKINDLFIRLRWFHHFAMNYMVHSLSDEDILYNDKDRYNALSVYISER